VAGHHRENAFFLVFAPFVASLVNVGVTDAAKLNVDQDVVFAEFPPFERKGSEWGARGWCSIAFGFDRYEFGSVRHDESSDEDFFERRKFEEIGPAADQPGNKRPDKDTLTMVI
jgi:hypothetical protein